jgi:archaemetzincin
MNLRPVRPALLAVLVLGAALLGRAAILRTIPADEEDAPPADSPTLRAIRAAGEKLRPLHRRKSPPRPGEWLDRHKEVGQTFDAYLQESPNRPNARRTTIYLQPLGDLDADQGRLVALTGELLGLFYGVPVKRLDPIGLDAIPPEARRVHPEWGDRQILSTYVLDRLRRSRPDDAVAVLALTTADLWPGQGWNFVFGQASLGDRVGVWSLYRLGDPRKDFTTALRRTLKTAVHETGHMLGIRHCTAYECGMNGSNHQAEADGRPLGFCPECEMKVWWACRLDPAARDRRLAAFAESHGLDREARAWRAEATALRDPPISRPVPRLPAKSSQ